MRSSFLNRILFTLAGVVMAACGSESTSKNDDLGNDDNTGSCVSTGATGSKTLEVMDDIAIDTCWTADTVYFLNPKLDGTYVKVRPGATLTIEAGTTVKGRTGSALIVVRGGKLVANGTMVEPIVFTSAKPEGSRTGGDWGGILMLGNAPTNWDGNDQLFEALPATDTEGRYGGTDAADSSGSLRYVRIEFAGYEYASGKEFNSLTLGGVGSGTVIDYVQVHQGSDDGIELFGGTVNVKHLVSSQNQDDGFDTDNGWIGKAQFLVVQHLNGKSNDPNGYESDNHPSAFDATPRTEPMIWNATLIGDMAQAKPSFGAVLRRGTAGKYMNQIFLNFPSAALEVRNTETVAQYPEHLAVRGSIFFHTGMSTANWSSAQVDFDESASFTVVSESNRAVDPALSEASSLTAPNYLPTAGSPALSGGLTPPNDGFFDTSATFVGAMGSTDWTAGWTAYPQN